MPPRRILHVAQPVEAGVAVVASQLVRHQLGRGQEVAVACPPTGFLPDEIRAAGGTVLPWPADRSPGRSVPGELKALRRIVRQWSPDLVHLHSSKAGLVGRLAVRGRIPTVYQPHGWSFLAVTGALRRATLAWERWATSWTDVVICVSVAEQHAGADLGLQATWAVCSNGIDLTRFRPATAAEQRTARADLGVGDRPVVLCVGRLCEQKGQDLLLDAWARHDTGAALLILVGDGPDRAVLEARAGADVVFAGQRSDLRSWYAAASLFVQPSRWEGASLTTREAMASGLSVVATDVAGAREAVGTAGALVKVGDVAGLAAALRLRLRDPELTRREGALARAAAETRLDLDRALTAVQDVYEQAISPRKG